MNQDTSDTNPLISKKKSPIGRIVGIAMLVIGFAVGVFSMVGTARNSSTSAIIAVVFVVGGGLVILFTKSKKVAKEKKVDAPAQPVAIQENPQVDQPAAFTQPAVQPVQPQLQPIQPYQPPQLQQNAPQAYKRPQNSLTPQYRPQGQPDPRI